MLIDLLVKNAGFCNAKDENMSELNKKYVDNATCGIYNLIVIKNAQLNC